MSLSFLEIKKEKTYTVFAISLLLVVSHLKAQVYGCTDINATNYNSSATNNDGTCIYNSASVTPTATFNLAAILKETSGLIKWNNSVWTHNDNSDTTIYALDTLNGNIVQSHALSGIRNEDWEEISQDDTYIYIGDFGNNGNGNRTDLKILRIDKNSILANSPVIDSINFSYSNQSDFSPAGPNNTDFDCEAFIVTADSIFLFTKQWVSNKTSLYSLPKTPGTHIANLKYTFDVQGLITGATFIESKKLIALCAYTNLLQPFIYLLYDYNGTDYFSGNKRKITISLSFHQVEGIATSNGLKYYISNEYFSKPPYVTNPQQLHILDLSSFLNNYLGATITAVSENKIQRSFSISPNPATNQVNVKLNGSSANSIYTITDQSGKTVLTGKINAENTVIEIGHLSQGVYIININNVKQTFRIVKN